MFQCLVAAVVIGVGSVGAYASADVEKRSCRKLWRLLTGTILIYSKYAFPLFSYVPVGNGLSSESNYSK